MRTGLVVASLGERYDRCADVPACLRNIAAVDVLGYAKHSDDGDEQKLLEVHLGCCFPVPVSLQEVLKSPEIGTG